MASKKITQMTPALALEDSDLLTGVDLSKVGGTPTEANVKIERQNLGFAEDDDPRLSDARTPTAHASTHGAGQSDAVTVTSAQVSDFNTSVASNSAVSANTTKVSADGSVATHSDVGLTGVAEGNALIWRTNQFEPEALPSGVSDHGDLSGLADDDHTQYFNAARGDARYLQTESDPVFTASPAAAVKNDGVATEYLNGTGAYSTPAGGGGGGVTLVTTDRPITQADNGYTLGCNSAASINLTEDGVLSAGFVCYVSRLGTGAVTVTPNAADTINGAVAPISIDEQYQEIKIVRYA